MMYLARANTSVRTFDMPGDISPTSLILHKGDMFISSQSRKVGNVVYYEISDKVDKYEGLPYTNWVPAKVLDLTPIEEYEADEEIRTENHAITVVGNSCKIYDRDGAMLPMTIPVGTVLQTNKVKISGDVVKLHISQSDGNSLNGMWILSDGDIRIHNNTRNIITSANNQQWDSTSNQTALRNMFTDSIDISTATGIGNPSVTAVSGIIASGIGNIVSTNDYNGFTDAWSFPALPNDSNTNGSAFANTPSTTTPATPDVVDTNAAETLAAAEEEYDMVAREYDDMFAEYGFDYNIDTSLMSAPIGRMVFVHGMPFQYTAITDRRNYSLTPVGDVSPEDAVKTGNSDMYGRIFAKEIAANVPIVTFVPGTPIFLTNVKQSILGYAGGSSNDAKNNWIPLWSDLTSSEFDEAVQNLLSTDDATYNYYSMQIDTTDYFNYVNAQAQMSARLMGMTETFRGIACTNFDWGSYNSSVDQDYSTFEEVTGLSGGISFTFDPLSSVSDSISNSLGESQFVSMLNGLSSKARELEFMTGTAGVSLDMINTEDFEASIASIDDSLLSGVNNPLSRVTSFLTNASHGMNVRFPQIYQDSSYSKSYDLEMKFITPYATRFSKWRYVLVPFFTIFSLVAPRSPETIVNYQRPFLVRAFSPGYFNIEMGMIESITWKRFGSDNEMISNDGIPTEIDVSVSVIDLYPTLAMSKTGDLTGNFSQINVMFANHGFMEMIGTLSGVNMNRITLGERLSLFASTAIGAFSSTGSNIGRAIQDRTARILESTIVGL